MSAIDQSALVVRARTLARRIDALSLRERVMLFASAVALLAGLADALVLSPQFAQHKAMVQRMRSQNTELAALRERVAQSAAPLSADDSPRGRALSALLLVREEQAGLTRQLEALSPAPDAQASAAPGGPSQGDLPALLQRVLRRHTGLTLLQLATVADGGGERTPGAEPRVAAQALEIKLQGPYAGLQQYLAEIERSVPNQRFGTWELAAREGVPVLTLRLKLNGDAR